MKYAVHGKHTNGASFTLQCDTKKEVRGTLNGPLRDSGYKLTVTKEVDVTSEFKKDGKK